MNTLHIPCKTDEVSDGYHTFGELYEHRIALFLVLMKSAPKLSWFSEKHDDGSSFDGWIICGMRLPTGDVTYHLPANMITMVRATGAEELSIAPKWDGHTPKDVVNRLTAMLYA